jgi:hypothetical protein
MLKFRKKKKSVPLLRRYTSLPSLLLMLQSKSITLLSPSTWDDRNDRHFMNEYRHRKKLETVLALCFTSGDETYHHWRVFTDGSDGVCITFDRDKLVESLKKYRRIKCRSVSYKKVPEIRKLNPKVSDLPFLKRYPYSDEREFRLVYTDVRNELDAKSFAIPLSCIKRVTLNPWLPEPLVEVVKRTICSVDASCEKIKVYQTSLLENKEWKRAADRSVLK